jgi:hypothetical protein
VGTVFANTAMFTGPWGWICCHFHDLKVDILKIALLPSPTILYCHGCEKCLKWINCCISKILCCCVRYRTTECEACKRCMWTVKSHKSCGSKLAAKLAGFSLYVFHRFKYWQLFWVVLLFCFYNCLCASLTRKGKFSSLGKELVYCRGCSSSWGQVCEIALFLFSFSCNPLSPKGSLMKLHKGVYQHLILRKVLYFYKSPPTLWG